MSEPRYRFLGHPCTSEQATAWVDNLVYRDTWGDALVVRQRTQLRVRLIRGTTVQKETA